MADYLAGEGDYYLMKKVNGVWTVNQTVMGLGFVTSSWMAGMAHWEK
jgi:hypothetical protein